MKNRREWFTQWLAQRDLEEEDAYCNDLLSKRMSAAGFISTVEVAHLEVGKSFTEIEPFRDELWYAIETAYAANEPWLRLYDCALHIGPIWLELDPRAAALWLLSRPLYRHLVPPHWARVVLGDAKPMPKELTSKAAVSGEKPEQRAHGPKPEQRDRVTREMRQMQQRDPRRLAEMLEKEMEGEFRASRTTCRAARNRVLAESQFVGV